MRGLRALLVRLRAVFDRDRLDAVLLHPLPFPRSEELVIVWATNADNGNDEDVTSYPNFEDWRSATRSFEHLAAFTTRGMTLSGGEGHGLEWLPGPHPVALETLLEPREKAGQEGRSSHQPHVLDVARGCIVPPPTSITRTVRSWPRLIP